MQRGLTLTCLLVVLSLCLPVRAQMADNYRLRVGDELIVTFLAQPDQNYVVDIQDDECFYLPLTGAVHAQGVTVTDLVPVVRH